MKKKATTALKVIISGLLLYFVFNTINTGNFFEYLSSLPLVALCAALLLVFGSKYIAHFRLLTLFRFVEAESELVEIELGNARNESSTIALMKAIEGGVLEIINTGYDRGFWILQNNNQGVELNNEIKIDKPDCDDECVDDIRG